MQLTTPSEPQRHTLYEKYTTTSVANVLRDQIMSGRFKAGDWLPTEQVLAENLGVQRRIVRRAINKLIESGLVIRRPRRRPIVANPPVAVASGAAIPVAVSNFIALMMWQEHGAPGYSLSPQQRIFWGMNKALAKAGYHAIFVNLGVSTSEKENAAREAEKLRYLRERGFGGAAFCPYACRSNSVLVDEIAATIPIITIERRIDGAATDFVGLDNRQIMHTVINHLIAQGHRRIAYVTKNEPIHSIQDRIQGYIDAVHDAGLQELVLSIPSRDKEQEWTAIDMVFQLPKARRPTAAAVFNDDSAVDLLRRLETFGLSAPRDIALTGFGDTAPTLPRGLGLTTVTQPYEEIGREAAEVLLHRLRNPSGPKRSIELTAQLVVRESSCAPDDCLD